MYRIIPVSILLKSVQHQNASNTEDNFKKMNFDKVQQLKDSFQQYEEQRHKKENSELCSNYKCNPVVNC